MVTEVEIFAMHETALADWVLAAAQNYSLALVHSHKGGEGERMLAMSEALRPFEHHDEIGFASVLLQASERRERAAKQEGNLLKDRLAVAQLELAVVQAVRRWRDGDGLGALGLLLELLALRSSAAGVKAAAELLRAGRLRSLDGTTEGARIGHRFIDLAMTAAASDPDAEWLLSNIEGHSFLWDDTIAPMVCVGRVRAKPHQWLELLTHYRGSFAAARPMVRRVNLRALVDAAGLVSVVQDTGNMLALVADAAELIEKMEAVTMLFSGAEAPLKYQDEAINFGDSTYTLFDPYNTKVARFGLGSLTLSELNYKFAVLYGDSSVTLEDYDVGFGALEIPSFMPKRTEAETGAGDLFDPPTFEQEAGKAF